MEISNETLRVNAVSCIKRYKRSKSYERLLSESPIHAEAIANLKAEDFEIIPVEKTNRKFKYLYENEYPYLVNAMLTVNGKTKKVRLGTMIRTTLDKDYGERYSLDVKYYPVCWLKRKIIALRQRYKTEN